MLRERKKEKDMNAKYLASLLVEFVMMLLRDNVCLLVPGLNPDLR